MALGRPMPPLVLNDDEVQQLQGIASSRSLPHSIVQRAQIVLACGAGETNTAIAQRMGLSGMTVGKWRKRYRELGLEGLHDELRPGRPRTYEDDQVAEVINRALQTKPTDGSTHWSARSLAAATGISKTTVHRWLQTFSVQPHRQKSFKLSTDPLFVEKVRSETSSACTSIRPTRRWCSSSTRRRRSRPWQDSAAAAHGPGLRGGRHPRLHPPRHHHPVRCTGCGHR